MMTLLPSFKEWPKIARWNRDVIITEKIDGTNGCIHIEENGNVLAGSRTRWITPGKEDNFGFAQWAYDHKEELLKLGPGYHYGEWWGNGIQRGYGMPKGVKNFSLFNVLKWQHNPNLPECCKTVPILYAGKLSTLAIEACLSELRMNGSKAAPFMNPEGIVIYHTAGNVAFKITLEGDEKPKGKNEPSL
jgi:hypothetical protein